MPRRFAPRNDMQKFAACPHNSRALPVYCRKTALHPQKRLFLLHSSAPNALATATTLPPFACHCEPVRTLVRQSASPQGNPASWRYFRQIRSTSRIRLKYCSSLCTAARSTDCHVASLLAMTCRNMHLCAYATKWCHGKFMGLTYLPLGTALRHAPPQELRIVPSLRSSQWQKEGGLGLSRQ